MTATNENAVDIWYTRCGGATASTIAIRQGLLGDEFAGSEVSLQSLQETSDPTIRESHFDHSIRSMFREGGNIPPIWARANGADTVVLGITWVDEFQSIVVRADSEIRSLADLAGRRLALPFTPGISIDFQRGANAHGLSNGLALAGLRREDVTFVDVKSERGSGPSGGAQLQALFAGDVDAVFLRQASGYNLSHKHHDELRELVRLTDQPDPLRRVNNGTPRPLTVHRSFLDEQPDLVVRYIAALLRAGQWAQANPFEAVAAVAAEDRVDPATTAATFPHLSTSLIPRLSADYVRGLEAQKDFLHQWGFFERNFEIDAWIVHEPLERAQALVNAETAIAAE